MGKFLGSHYKDDVSLTATRKVHVPYQPSVHKFYSLKAIAMNFASNQLLIGRHNVHSTLE
jgi:hypothetical protein